MADATVVAKGSSPLARGLRPAGGVCTLIGGIIPARAGVTCTGRRSSPRPGDHPRSRGVYIRNSWPLRPIPGSSPLARGLRALWPAWGSCGGIIPARAGFTPSCSSIATMPTDHPRSRGVYVTLGVAGDPVEGSSPLARGLRAGRGPARGHRRIIPARAGFTGDMPDPIEIGGDHPRSRGVYLPPRASRMVMAGSSPLARGLLVFVVALALGAGIIPARAGFTRC